MAINGATLPDGRDPADDPLIRETLRLWSYMGRPLVKDFGFGMIALEMAGGMRGTREELVTMWDLLCYLYEHLLRESERDSKMKSRGY
jgi:hypothetical protein